MRSLMLALALLVAGPGSLTVGASPLDLVPDPDPVLAFAEESSEATLGPFAELFDGLDQPVYDAAGIAQDRVDATRGLAQGTAFLVDRDLHACAAADAVPSLEVPREVRAPEPDVAPLEAYLQAWQDDPTGLSEQEIDCRLVQAQAILAGL